MKIYSFIVALILLFSLSACIGNNPKPHKQKAPLPKWINSSLPNDTATTMYGMAIAKNRNIAIKSALSDMVSRLGISIESNYESVEKASKYASSLHVKNSIKSEISKIKINNYKVIKSYRINYKEFAIMLTSDKQKFIAGLKADVQIKKTSLLQQKNALNGSNSFKKYRFKKALMQDAKKLLPTVFMIAQLDTNYNTTQDIELINSYEADYLKASSQLKFFVKGDKKSQSFVNVIKNDLSKHGFRVSASPKNAILIHLKTTDNLNKNVDIAVITLNISVYERSSRLGGKTIIMKEYYNGSKRNVYKNATLHLQEDIDSGEIEFYQSLTP